jgi:hypothetical protein
MILKKSDGLYRGPCPGSEKIGCEEIWKRRNQDVEMVLERAGLKPGAYKTA